MLSSGCSVYGKKLSQASLSPSLPSHNRTATWNVAKIKNYTTRTLQTWSFSLTEENMTLLELRSKLQTEEEDRALVLYMKASAESTAVEYACEVLLPC